MQIKYYIIIPQLQRVDAGQVDTNEIVVENGAGWRVADSSKGQEGKDASKPLLSLGAKPGAIEKTGD